jgi:ABC-type amino acid transport substrate-binding protein
MMMKILKNIKPTNAYLTLFIISSLFFCMASPPMLGAEVRPHFTIAASAQSPPFSYVDKNNRPQGMLIDFWNLWARKNNADVTFVMDSFDKTIEMVSSGVADFHAGLFYSEQRAKYLDFSAGFLDDTLSLFVPDKLDIKSISDLKNIPVAVGISKEYYAVEYMKKHYPYVNIRLYLNNEELLKSTMNREIVAFIVDYPVALHYLSKNDSLGMYSVVQDVISQKLRAAVKKEQRGVLKFINDGLTKISKQELDSLSDKWGLRQHQIIPEWLKKTLIIGSILIILLAFFIHWILLKREVRKQISDLDEKNKILTLMQRDMMEVNRTVQSQMEDLAKLGRDNEQMLDIITREMKTPIEGISAVAAGKDVSREILDEIRSKSENVLLFIEKFMEVSRLDSENYSRELIKINLNSFFEKKMKDFKNISLMKGIKLNMEIPTEPLSAMLNPEHFDELCNNIFLSAIKYSSPNGPVGVSLESEKIDDEKKVVLKFRYHSIADSERIEAEQRESSGSIQQLQPVESTSGIRLAIVKKLVQLQGGNIFAKVDEKGERIIVVELPALEEIIKTYEDVEALLQTGDIILFKGLYANNWGETRVADDWTHVGMIVRLPGNPSPLIWESTPLDNIPDVELKEKKSGAQLVYLKQRLETYETDVFAIRHLKVVRDAAMMESLLSFIYYARTLTFPDDLQMFAKVIRAKIFGRFYRMKRRYKNIFCTELVSESYMRMGLLPPAPPPSAYMPVDFSARKKLPLLKGAYLSTEVMIKIGKKSKSRV